MQVLVLVTKGNVIRTKHLFLFWGYILIGKESDFHSEYRGSSPRILSKQLNNTEI